MELLQTPICTISFKDIVTSNTHPFHLVQDVTFFNRTNNKTAHLEKPYSVNLDTFLEEMILAQGSISEHCHFSKKPQDCYLLNARKFYQEQAKKLVEIGICIDELWDYVVFGSLNGKEVFN